MADGGVQGEPPACEEEEAGGYAGNLVPLLAPLNVLQELKWQCLQYPGHSTDFLTKLCNNS